MHRHRLQHPQNWLQSARRKPLVIRRARQVGKSTLVDLFCRSASLDLVGLLTTVNCTFSTTENCTVNAGLLVGAFHHGGGQAAWGLGMHGMGTRMLLRRHLEAGASKAELAGRFGVSRRTIRHWVESGRPDWDLGAGAAHCAVRPAVAHKLDPHKGIIDARLAEHPKLSSQRLFDEARAAGCPGGCGRVGDCVQESRPREPSEPVVRFETPAGRRGQVDFGTFAPPWGRRHALLVALGHSRLLWLRFLPRRTMDAPFAGLEGAFARFGGVPDELLFDRMRAVAASDGRLDGGAPAANAEFRRFARHWGFRVRARCPHRACAKGKVERPIRHVRDSFLHGRGFVGDGDLDEQARRWLDGTANVRGTARRENGRRTASSGTGGRRRSRSSGGR